MQSTKLETALRGMVGIREDGATDIPLNLPATLTDTSTGVTLDDLHELLTLTTIQRTMRLGTVDVAVYLTNTRDAAIRATLNVLDVKLAEAGLVSQLLTPSPVFRTQDTNLRMQPKWPGRQVGVRILPRLADVTATIERIQFAMTFIAPFSLNLTLREEGEMAVLATITLNQTMFYQWHTVQLPPLARNTAYWLTYNEDDLSHAIDPATPNDLSYAYSAYNTLSGFVRPGNCQGCQANCPGSYALIQPMYIDAYYRAQLVSDTNYGLNLTLSAQTDLTARFEAAPLRLSAVYRLQLAITFLEKIAFSRRHNPDTAEAIQAALFELRGTDNAERLPTKLEKAWSAFIKSVQKEVSPALSADTYGSVDFENDLMQAAIVNRIMGPLLAIPIEQLVDQAIAVHQEDMAALNRAQLKTGKTAEGVAISPFYKPVTVTMRRKKGLQTSFVDLYETGTFYQGINAKEAGPGKTELDSNDPKSRFLAARYQVAIFGLSVASKEQFSQLMRPTLQQLYKQALR